MSRKAFNIREGLADCTGKHGVEKYNQCKEFPCDKITDMLERSKKYQEKCKIVCSEEERIASLLNSP